MYKGGGDPHTGWEAGGAPGGLWATQVRGRMQGGGSTEPWICGSLSPTFVSKEVIRFATCVQTLTFHKQAVSSSLGEGDGEGGRGSTHLFSRGGLRSRPSSTLSSSTQGCTLFPTRYKQTQYTSPIKDACKIMQGFPNFTSRTTCIQGLEVWTMLGKYKNLTYSLPVKSNF